MAPYHYLQILFLISEVSLLLFRRSKSSGEKVSKDRRSLLILWIVIVLSSTLGNFIAENYSWHIGNYEGVMYTGMAICIIGFAIRWAAVIQLGKMFTVDVAIADKHNLKKSGLYKIVRHPSYLGLILIIAGLATCINNIASALVIIIPSFWAINHRIIVEEQALVAEFGEQYTDYKKRVSKIIPGIF